LRDVDRFVHQHLAHRQTLDFHRENLIGKAFGFIGIVCHFDSAGFAASAHKHLGFDDHALAYLRGDLACLVCGGGNFAVRNRHAVLRENGFGLILV